MEKSIYDRVYKFLLLVPVLVMILSVIYVWNFHRTNGDIIYKDVSLTGGTTLSLFDSNVDINALEKFLKKKFDDINLRGISDFRTGKQKGVIIETSSKPDELKSAVEEFLGYKLTQENSSVEFSGASLSAGFYKQLRFAIILAFIFMAATVFLIFRTFVPSIAVIFAAFSDIVMTLAVVDMIGMKLSTAGIIAFLMLIGYSVDTDILLTTRVLKQKNISINRRIAGAFKTGIMMTLTSLVALSVAFIITKSASAVLGQIFSILLIGLGFDIVNTWFTNASIIKLYAEKKENRK